MTSYLERFARRFIPPKWRPILREAYNAFRSILYVGRGKTCPCCDRHFRKFLPYGVTRRENARCPRCDSLERHRLLWLYLVERTNLFSEHLTLLHFAPEHFFQRALRSRPNLRYLSVDLSSPLVMVRTDATEMALKDNSVDVILCSHMLEHIIDDREALKELFRVLKPGGWAIIQSPIDPAREKTFEDETVVLLKDRERVFGQEDHVRIYGLDYGERLREAGFVVTEDPYVRDLDADFITRHGLERNVDIFRCDKPRVSK